MPLTPHELSIVLAHNALKLSAWMPLRLARSRTIQAALMGLNDSEFNAVKLSRPQTFAELMDRIGEQQMLRKRGDLKSKN